MPDIVLHAVHDTLSPAPGIVTMVAAVSSHVEHVYVRLGGTTRTEAALFAMRHGLIGMADEPGT